ncbi:hypothetical protein HHK36_016951 [Tetracentron sinense]|uniref:MATH domain-containing protein n=1 Tax=Tetracentron sinense TaxID=13715 RepID=A0A834Z290_TETSI|nr:hypothetical protein HHK36_016951 [Tetracentron sinense]
MTGFFMAYVVDSLIGEGDDEMLVPHSDFTELPQPMEVAQAETATTVENQLVEDPPLSSFRWTIENFSRLNNKKYYSQIFLSGGYRWRVLIFPKGNYWDNFSMYLDVADSANLPYWRSRRAQFSLAVVNQIHNKYTVRKCMIFPYICVVRILYLQILYEFTLQNVQFNGNWLFSIPPDILHVEIEVLGMPVRSNDNFSIFLHSVDTQHQFNARNSNWGFPSFMPLSELYDPARGYLVNDTCIVQAKVAVRRVVNGTEDIIWDPLIVNDEETMAVKTEPKVEAIISAEGITEEPAITNEEPSITLVAVPPPCSPSPSTSMGPPAFSPAPPCPLRMNTEELDSIVNKYPISKAHKSTWRDIVKKYGDIAHKSNIKNSKMKAACIETICDIISVLKGTDAQGLTM